MYITNTVAADHLATQVPRASAAMVLIQFSQNVPYSEGFWFYAFNAMAVKGLETQGARASAAMVATKFYLNIPTLSS